MPNPVETILTSVGLPPEDITVISSLTEEQLKTFDPKPYVDKVKGNFQTQLQNDPSFFSDLTLEKLPPEIKKKIENSQYNRVQTITREKFLKGLGMTEADLNDLTDEQKEKLEMFIPTVTEKYTKKHAGDKQLQNDLIEARKKLESFEGFEEKTKEKYETESNQRITSAIFNANLISELSTIPGLKIPPSDLAKTANEILTSKYGFERVGDFAVELRQKANPQMKVLKEGSSKEVTLKDALLEIASERGWIEKEKEGGQGKGTIKIEPGKNGTLNMIPPHLQQKISDKIAAEK